MINKPLNLPTHCFLIFQTNFIFKANECVVSIVLYSHKARFCNQSDCALYLDFIISNLYCKVAFDLHLTTQMAIHSFCLSCVFRSHFSLVWQKKRQTKFLVVTQNWETRKMLVARKQRYVKWRQISWSYSVIHLSLVCKRTELTCK